MPDLQTRANLNYRYYVPPDSLVYVLKGKRLYKIGYSTHLKKRLAELQIGSEFPLTLIATIDTAHPKQLEASLHDKFQAKWHHGEWFALTKRDITWMQTEISTVSSTQ